MTVADIHPPTLPTTTPLLEALKAEKSAQKDKEAILRNHAHYKDIHAAAIHAPSSSKREDKKKATQTSNPSGKGVEQPLSKKAAKKAAAAESDALQKVAEMRGKAELLERTLQEAKTLPQVLMRLLEILESGKFFQICRQHRFIRVARPSKRSSMAIMSFRTAS